MLRMRGRYGLMADADAATDMEDLDRLLARMRDIETTAAVNGGDIVRQGMVVGSRAHMSGEAVAKVTGEAAVSSCSVLAIWAGG